MTLYVLDTDHLTLLRYGQAAVTARVDDTPVDQLATTIVTIEEQLTGWYTQIRKSRDLEKLARSYAGLFQVIESVTLLRVLPFTRPALQRYFELRKLLPRLGKLDLAISAIVLEYNGVLVTRNRRDFEQVPGLSIEDWTQS